MPHAQHTCAAVSSSTLDVAERELARRRQQEAEERDEAAMASEARTGARRAVLHFQAEFEWRHAMDLAMEYRAATLLNTIKRKRRASECPEAKRKNFAKKLAHTETKPVKARAMARAIGPGCG